MALSDEIQDAITRHQIFLIRYSSGRAKEAAEYIDRISRFIEENLVNQELNSLNYARLKRLQFEIEKFSDEVLSDLEEKIVQDAVQLTDQETDWNVGNFETLIGELIAPPSEINSQLAVFASAILAAGGLNIRQSANRFRQNKLSQITQNISDSVTLRESNEQVLSRVNNFSQLHKKQAGVLIQTLSNHVSVQTRNMVMSENIGLFDGYEWVAVLDSRTSLVCASRDGKIYPLSDNPEISPKPPAHFNCRSTITPKVKAGYEDRVQKPSPRTAEGAKGKTKVRQTTTYESWLKRQPASFQDEVLGKTRGKLFRRGGLEISKFVDFEGRPITLDELRKLEPEVFNRVKL